MSHLQYQWNHGDRNPLARFLKVLNSSNGIKLHPRTWFFESIKIAFRHRVVTGPFRGMRYISQSVGSTCLPKLLGTYELELHPLIADLEKVQFDRIVDVGAAEGYYAVGMARQFPDADVVTFEIEELGQQLLAKMAAFNNVKHRMNIRGECELDDLREVLSPTQTTLLVMDVEGYEAELLNPIKVQSLQSCHILLEVHDCIIEGVGDLIKQRFEMTHTITSIPVQRREMADAPGLLKWLNFYPLQAWVLSTLDECRPLDMYWFYLQPLKQNSLSDRP